MTDAATVAKPLREISRRGHNHFTVFDDWVAATLAALCRDDETYLERIQSYPNDDEWGEREADLFSEATGELFKATAKSERDILGEVYEELGLHNRDNGQFFTSHDATKLIVELTIDDSEELITDPTCGSGRLLLEASKSVPEALLVGRDLDVMCARMAAINCCLFNLDSIIIHGDSLKLTRENAWRTVQTDEGGAVTSIDPDDVAWIDGGYGADGDSGTGSNLKQTTLQEVSDDD